MKNRSDFRQAIFLQIKKETIKKITIGGKVLFYPKNISFFITKLKTGLNPKPKYSGRHEASHVFASKNYYALCLHPYKLNNIEL